MDLHEGVSSGCFCLHGVWHVVQQLLDHKEGIPCAQVFRAAPARCFLHCNSTLIPSISTALQSTVCRYSNGTSQYTSYELSTEDKLEITEMMNKFDMVLNLGQQERIGQFFSPDAVVNVDMGTTAVPVKAIKGAEPIVEYFKSVRTMAAGR